MICAKLRLIIYANSYSDLIMLRPNGVAKGATEVAQCPTWKTPDTLLLCNITHCLFCFRKAC